MSLYRFQLFLERLLTVCNSLKPLLTLFRLYATLAAGHLLDLPTKNVCDILAAFRSWLDKNKLIPLAICQIMVSYFQQIDKPDLKLLPNSLQDMVSKTWEMYS